MNLPPLPSEISFLKEFIHQSALPCIALSLSCDVPTHPRTSKLGGDADLPAGVEWPTHEGEPLGFLLQIVLSEIGFATDFGLPADGILSFFYDLEECPWDPEIGSAFRVLYSPSGAITEPVCSPGGSSHLPECAIRFRRGASLPYFGSTALGDFEQLIRSSSSSEVSEDDINDCADAYGSFCADVAQHGSESPDGGPHRMFGHPENIQDEMRAHDPEWVLLLQLASDDAIGMSWGAQVCYTSG